MRLAVLDGLRLAVVLGDEAADVTGALPWPHDSDPLTAGWWRRLCRDLDYVRPALAKAAEDPSSPRIPLGDARQRLLAPVVNPSKVVAAASNYAGHVAEMHDVQRRTLGRVEAWMMRFDVFLKAPSSICGPRDEIELPPAQADAEIHHEAELVAIVGKGGRDIPASRALDSIAGYTIGLDVTVRGEGDRSRRKSYDTFSPLGPWLVTADEAGDPADFDIELECNGVTRQRVSTRDMLVPVADIVGYASTIMTLLPGDVIFTGAPPGVGAIRSGDKLRVRISRLGEMEVGVR